jgi:hypothetical protein
MENMTVDRNVAFILNDFQDVLEQLTGIVRELNPGARYGEIEFLLERTDRYLKAAGGSTVPPSEPVGVDASRPATS